MKRYIPLLLLTSCAWHEPLPMQPIAIHQAPDPAAGIMMQCDGLRFTHPETHRLCVMRGVDRLAIAPSKPTISHVPLLPYAYPPLVPGASGAPYHYHFPGVR